MLSEQTKVEHFGALAIRKWGLPSAAQTSGTLVARWPEHHGVHKLLRESQLRFGARSSTRGF